MKLQNFQEKNKEIADSFKTLQEKHPERLKRPLNLSWSNWGFGLEPLQSSARRLQKAGISYIELHGNHYGPDLGYNPAETLKVLADNGLTVSGICGMFSNLNDLSSNRPQYRQSAIDYIRREVEFAEAVGGTYLLVVPGSVGRPDPYDDSEFERSVTALRLVADAFIEHGVHGAVEPIRVEEVSLVHNIADAKRFIEAVDHPGVKHINGDVFHMQVGEPHIGQAILQAGEMLLNLHVADSNRTALGDGSLDLDTIIMSLYLIGYNREGCYVTPEPLGPGGDPYRAMNGIPDPDALDRMVLQTARYFREREEIVARG